MWSVFLLQSTHLQLISFAIAHVVFLVVLPLNNDVGEQSHPGLVVGELLPTSGRSQRYLREEAVDDDDEDARESDSRRD